MGRRYFEEDEDENENEFVPPRPNGYNLNQQQKQKYNGGNNGNGGGKQHFDNNQKNRNDKPNFNPNQGAKAAKENESIYQEVVLVEDGDSFLMVEAFKFFSVTGHPISSLLRSQVKGYCMMQGDTGLFLFYKDTDPEYQLILDRLNKTRDIIWGRVEEREKKHYNNRRSAKGALHGIKEIPTAAYSFWSKFAMGSALLMVLFIIFLLMRG